MATPTPLVLVAAAALLLLLLASMPGGAHAYYSGHRRHQGPTGHLRASTVAAADNYTCSHAPLKAGVRGRAVADCLRDRFGCIGWLGMQATGTD